MKTLYIVLFIVTSFLLNGCSSIYTVNDFPSKEIYFKEFNRIAVHKNVNILLDNDSSFSAENGVIIENNVLYSLNQRADTTFYKTALSEIKEIKYTGTGNKSAFFVMTNTVHLKAENIRIQMDTAEYTGIIYGTVKDSISLINHVRTISYKNRFIETFIGTFLGVPIGFVGGLIAGAALDKSNDGLSSFFYVMGAPIGAVLGSIIGAVTGYSYIYVFNSKSK